MNYTNKHIHKRIHTYISTYISIILVLVFISMCVCVVVYAGVEFTNNLVVRGMRFCVGWSWTWQFSCFVVGWLSVQWICWSMTLNVYLFYFTCFYFCFQFIFATVIMRNTVNPSTKSSLFSWFLLKITNKKYIISPFNMIVNYKLLVIIIVVLVVLLILLCWMLLWM